MVVELWKYVKRRKKHPLKVEGMWKEGKGGREGKGREGKRDEGECAYSELVLKSLCRVVVVIVVVVMVVVVVGGY